MSDFYERVTALKWRIRRKRKKSEKERRAGLRKLGAAVLMSIILSVVVVLIAQWILWPEPVNIMSVLPFIIALTLLHITVALSYTPQITVTVSGQRVNVSYPVYQRHELGYTTFLIDDIKDARIVTAKDPEARRLIAASNEKIKTGNYMYALFLSDGFPLPDGHQAVELELRNGRCVLIETDDAENFLAALRSRGVGKAI